MLSGFVALHRATRLSCKNLDSQLMAGEKIVVFLLSSSNRINFMHPRFHSLTLAFDANLVCWINSKLITLCNYIL